MDRQLVVNQLAYAINRARQLGDMYPGYFAQGDTKRKAPYQDYGYPESPVFADYFHQYERNGFARAGVRRMIEKCWQDFPYLLEREASHDETQREADVRQLFERLQFWNKLAETDEKSRVGEYAGVILRLADDKQFREPVDRVPGGPDGLVELIPVYEQQLEVARWDTDEMSETYGHPMMYHFKESAVDTSQANEKGERAFDVHPDRVVIWSRDGMPRGTSALKSGLNDLITLQKIIGAGGEGFWQSARQAPFMKIDPEANLHALAQSLGVDSIDEIKDALGDEVKDWKSGLDNLLALQGVDMQTPDFKLADPENFVNAPLMSFAASVNTPLKILVGNQTGERASTEDQRDWSQTNMSRRIKYVIPNIRRVIDRLVEYRILPALDWFLDWSDLTESTMSEKVERAKTMAEINKALLGTGERAFTADEIRDALDMEPLAPEDEGAPDVDPDDELEDDEPRPPVRQSNRRGVRRIVVNVHRKQKANP